MTDATRQFHDLAFKTDAEVDAICRAAADSPLYNDDLAPAGPRKRTWNTWHILAMWIGMSVVLTTYTLAAGLMAAGMIAASPAELSGSALASARPGVPALAAGAAVFDAARVGAIDAVRGAAVLAEFERTSRAFQRRWRGSARELGAGAPAHAVDDAVIAVLAGDAVEVTHLWVR